MDWYKDAIVYETHIRSFRDADGNGFGDFTGLTSKLDYLCDLGITAIWLLPFYPSPLRDDGYDVSDFRSVHPRYGTLDDFRGFLDQAHRRDLRVITELIVNHTSDRHPWFQRARRAAPGSAERDFYVWSDTPDRYRDARIIFTDTETSNWTWDPVAGAYYWHRFFSHQPDLNYDNPTVRAEVLAIMDFWLDMGVDGLRLDAVPYLYEREGTNCENLPETHTELKVIRAHLDTGYEDRILVAEANQWPEDAAAYFGDGDESHMNYHFPLMPRLFLALARGDRTPIEWILDRTPAIPPSAQWGIFVRNHDELTLEMVTDEERAEMYGCYAKDPKAKLNVGIRRRLAPLLGNDPRKLRLMLSLLFGLPGTPFLYYGDEIGMGDDLDLPDRDGLRTPMQWDDGPNAGFSDADPSALYTPVIDDPEYGYRTLNVAESLDDHSSLLNWTRKAIAVRRRHPAFGRGDVEWLRPADPALLAYVLTYEDDAVLAVANLSDRTTTMPLPQPGTDLITGEPTGAGDLSLPPYGTRWLSVIRPPEDDEAA
ncbi:trehalose synthase/amylase TreS [bacterium BMS3Abin02]|nr:trehalose synthase/amylase TreS [bacterium BMS3Abin02]GBE22548.1 trehalose synthase/amylase TreS [bacterium BMS3Bbin01]HDH25081.1 maltose alpha-D-glucosyltransferase [Actinomycetota bacterium]